jgi:putative aldouronate transport system permease protein
LSRGIKHKLYALAHLKHHVRSKGKCKMNQLKLGGANRSKELFLSYMKRSWVLYLMILPAVLTVFVFNYLPLYGLKIAFERFIPAKGLFGDQRWVGLDNFKYIFSNKSTYSAIYNTIIISFFKIILGIIIPLTVSILLNEVRLKVFKKSVQTIIYFPYFISWVVLSGILFELLSPSTGLANRFLGLFGIEPIYFLGTDKYFKSVIVISDVWKTYGYSVVLYLASITNINTDLYEAAFVDGANLFQRIRRITIPSLIPLIVLLSVLSLGNILNAGFEQVYNLITPSTYGSGDIIDTLVFRMSIGGGNQYSPATAVGLLKSGITFIFISLGYYSAYKLVDYKVF